MRTSLSRVAFATLALGVLATAACRDDRASITEPFGSISYNARLLPAPQGIPSASYTYLAAANLPTVNGDRSVAASLVFSFAGLDSLIGTNVYQVFLGVESDPESIVPAIGELYVVRTDTTLDPVSGDPIIAKTTTRQSNVSSFQNGGSNITVFLVVNRTQFGATPFDESDFALVTIESNAGATTPTTTGPRPLFGRLNESLTFKFGTYDADPAKEMVFVASGRGFARFRDNVILVDDSALVRPPVGYYYETHILARDGDDLDEDASLNLGAQSAPFPRRNISLYDADVSIIEGIVVGNMIRAAANRVSVDTVAARAGAPDGFPFAGLREIYVTLEAKAGRPDVRSPSIVLVGTTPVEVAVPPSSDASTR